MAPTLLDGMVVLQWNHFLLLHRSVRIFAEVMGTYAVYLIPLTWVFWWFLSTRPQREILLSSITAGLVAWQGLNQIIKLIYTHPRPLQTLPVQEFIFTRPESAFPSDHAAFLGGITFFFFFVHQRSSAIWLLFFSLAICLSRIAIAAHYPIDIIIGFGNGLVIAWLMSLIHPFLSRTVWDHTINFAHKLHLA